MAVGVVRMSRNKNSAVYDPVDGTVCIGNDCPLPSFRSNFSSSFDLTLPVPVTESGLILDTGSTNSTEHLPPSYGANCLVGISDIKSCTLMHYDIAPMSQSIKYEV